jgi:hypothetical protein
MFKLTKALIVEYITALTGKEVKNDDDFSKRIKHRDKIFWQVPNAQEIKNTLRDASDPIEKWEDVENWQRKLSNKYNSREFAKKHNCRVAGLYWKGRDYNSIEFHNLPQNYVIRPTNGHSLNMVFSMKNGINLMDGKTYSKEDIKEVMAKALKENKRLEFLIEEFVRTENGEYKIPDDFKFYMFDGQIGFIQVINRNNNTIGYTSWYDENWNLLSNLTTNYS